jgi:hypothetical protein
MNANKYNREMINNYLSEIKTPHQKIEVLSKLKIDFLESTDQRDRFADALNQISKGGGLLSIVHFDKWCDGKINDQIEILKTNNFNMASKESGLSAFEIALKHYYLYLGDKENLTSRQIAEMYKGVKASKNIEMAYNDLLEKRKKGNKSQLKKVHDSLSEYPDVQKAIKNDIDKLT